MTTESGSGISSISKRFETLHSGEWGLHLTSTSSFAAENLLHDYRADECYAGYVHTDSGQPYQLNLDFGYFPDAALRSYDLLFHGVDDAKTVETEFARHKSLHRYYPDLTSFKFGAGILQLHSAVFELCTAYRGDDDREIEAPLILEFEFSFLQWDHNDSYTCEGLDPRFVPPKFDG